MQIKYYYTRRAKRLLKFGEICSNNKLHTQDGLFNGWFKDDKNHLIIIAQVGNTVVGCGLVRSVQSWVNCGVYVKPSFRKNGIGSNIYRRMEKLSKIKLHNDGSSSIFYQEDRKANI
jgi:predicted GNAT family acetyltransferase